MWRQSAAIDCPLNVCSLAFSPDGRFLAVGDEGTATGAHVSVFEQQPDGTWVWNSGTRETDSDCFGRGMSHPWPVRSLAWRDNMSFVAACSAFAQLWKHDGSVFDTFDRKQNEMLWILPFHDCSQLISMHFHNGELVCNFRESVRIFHVGQSTSTPQEMLATVYNTTYISCSPDGRSFASTDDTSESKRTCIAVEWLERRRQNEVGRYYCAIDYGACVQWSHNDRQLAVFSYTRGLSVYELNDGEWSVVFCSRECAGGSDVKDVYWMWPRLPHIAWSPDDGLIAIADPFVVHIVGTRRPVYQRINMQPGMMAFSLAWSADGRQLAIGEGTADENVDRHVRVFSL